MKDEFTAIFIKQLIEERKASIKEIDKQMEELIAKRKFHLKRIHELVKALKND